MPSSPPETYEDLLAEVLPVLDDGYRKSGKAVHERAFDAAEFIVKHMIVSIEGDSTDDHLSKPWFAGIYLPVVAWFERRYGVKAAHPQQPMCHAVVEHIGTFYLCAIPLTLTRKTEAGNRELVFPKEVLPDEDALDWITSPPDLTTMKPKRRAAFRVSAVKISNQVRSIHNDLYTAGDAASQATPVLGSVIRHLDKAALDICASDLAAHTLAAWDLQMACEKTIKAYLLKRGVSPPKTHNLRELHELAKDTLDWSDGRSLLIQFPTHARVIKWRQGELTPPSSGELARMYSVALAICCAYASRTPRKFIFNNFAIQFRYAPWH